jgi:predicted DNA-binding protein
MQKLPKDQIKQTRGFRITKIEYERLKKLAKSLNLTFADFIRDAILIYEENLKKN